MSARGTAHGARARVSLWRRVSRQTDVQKSVNHSRCAGAKWRAAIRLGRHTSIVIRETFGGGGARGGCGDRGEKAPRDRPCVEAFGRAWHTFQGLCLAGMPSAMGPTPGGVDRTKKTPEIEVPRAAKAPKASSRHARQWGEGLRRTFAAAPPGAPGGVRGSSARERAPGAARRPKRAARERGVCQQGSYSAVPIRDFAPGVGHYRPGPGRIDD